MRYASMVPPLLIRQSRQTFSPSQASLPASSSECSLSMISRQIVVASTTILLAMVMIAAQEVGAATVRFLGSDLARDCSASQNYFSYGSCSGYLMGVADMMARPEWPYPTKACFPDEVGRGQLVAIVKKYVANHPDQLQAPALDIVAAALAQAFPCPTR